MQKCLDCAWQGDFEELKRVIVRLDDDCYGMGNSLYPEYFCPNCGSSEVDEEGYGEYI